MLMRFGKDEKTKLISQVPLFANCSKAELQEIAAIADEIDIAEGKELTTEGSPGREFFVLIEGTADGRAGRRPDQRSRPRRFLRRDCARQGHAAHRHGDRHLAGSGARRDQAELQAPDRASAGYRAQGAEGARRRARALGAELGAEALSRARRRSSCAGRPRPRPTACVRATGTTTENAIDLLPSATWLAPVDVERPHLAQLGARPPRGRRTPARRRRPLRHGEREVLVDRRIRDHVGVPHLVVGGGLSSSPRSSSKAPQTPSSTAGWSSPTMPAAPTDAALPGWNSSSSVRSNAASTLSAA